MTKEKVNQLSFPLLISYVLKTISMVTTSSFHTLDFVLIVKDCYPVEPPDGPTKKEF